MVYFSMLKSMYNMCEYHRKYGEILNLSRLEQNFTSTKIYKYVTSSSDVHLLTRIIL